MFEGLESLFLLDEIGDYELPLPSFDEEPIFCDNAKRAFECTSESYAERDCFDVTPYTHMLQCDAAEKLDIAVSTLSKLWLRSSNGMVWPGQKVQRIDSQIRHLMQSLPDAAVEEGGNFPPEVEERVTVLLKKRASLLPTIPIIVYAARRKKRKLESGKQ